MIDYATARLNMVESQLRTNKVTSEAVLEAFLAVPRERFVPAPLSAAAYIDDDVPLGRGRYLIKPMVMARLIELANIQARDAVLVIGAGSGYGAAVLARLARQVVAVESDPNLAAQAAARLRELGAANVVVIEAPLEEGCSARAPYGVILFEGAVALIPDAIKRQMAEGGRLVAVIEAEGGMGQAVLMLRTNAGLSHRPAFDAAVPLLPGFAREASFVF